MGLLSLFKSKPTQINTETGLKEKSVLTDEDREKSMRIRQTKALERQTMKMLKDRLDHLQHLQEVKQLKDNIRQLEDDLDDDSDDGEEYDEDDDETVEDKLGAHFLNLFMNGSKGISTSTPNISTGDDVDTSGASILVSRIPPMLLNELKKYNAVTLHQAINIIKGEGADGQV